MNFQATILNSLSQGGSSV